MDNLNDFIKEHFIYEISMLQFTVQELRIIKSRSNLSNVLIESFVLHSRNIIDFYLIEETKKQEDDVIALDFKTKTNRWNRIVKEHYSTLNAIKIRANKELAHLTRKRKNGITTDKGWDHEEIYSIIYEIITTFISELEDFKLQSELQSMLKRIGFSH